jgi:hypothetical protein
MRAQTIVLVLALAVAAAGCGSKKAATTAASSGATTTTNTTTTSGTTGSGGTGGTSSSSASSSSSSSSSSSGSTTHSFASTKNCVQLEGAGRKFSQALAAASSSGKSSLTDVATIYTALAKAAPSEIRPDFETLAEAFGNYANALKKTGYTPGKVPTASQMAALASLSKTFSSPKLAAAEQHLSAWGKKNCGG